MVEQKSQKNTHKDNTIENTNDKTKGSSQDGIKDTHVDDNSTEGMASESPNILKGQPCPICHKDTLDLMENEMDIPYFGTAFIFSMNCNECGFHKADVEPAEMRDPCKITIEVSSEEDMKIRVVKSSMATVKIPHVVTIEPGPASNGYVTNIEGILERVKHEIKTAEDGEEDEETKKKARNLVKKLNRVTWGQEKLKIIIEDPSGNSAIISDKAEISKMKGGSKKDADE